MLILSGIVVIGGVSFLLLLGSGTTRGKGSFLMENLLPVCLYTLSGFCVYYGWKKINSPNQIIK